MTRHDTTPPPRPDEVVKTALEDWWITADPAAPFDPGEASRVAVTYLYSAGYTIRHHSQEPAMNKPRPRTTCDASARNSLGITGPCVLRHRHDGPVHQDRHGTTWWRTPDRVRRGHTLFSAFLTLLCLAAVIGALAAGSNGWAGLAGLGVLVFGCELVDDYLDHRARHRT